jgi:hypothetical protein
VTPLALARDRLTRLAATLLDLKARVRQAVAAELGRVVGDAIRDLVAALAGRSAALPEHRYQPGDSGRRQTPDPWDDDENGWEDEPDADPADVSEPVSDSPASPACRWWTAVAAGLGVARRLVAHATPPWAGAAAGLAVAGLALLGGPVVRAAVAAVHAAAGLLALTDPHSLAP